MTHPHPSSASLLRSLCSSGGKLNSNVSIQNSWPSNIVMSHLPTYSVATVGEKKKLFSASRILTIFRPEVGSSWSDFRVLLSSVTSRAALSSCVHHWSPHVFPLPCLLVCHVWTLARCFPEVLLSKYTFFLCVSVLGRCVKSCWLDGPPPHLPAAVADLLALLSSSLTGPGLPQRLLLHTAWISSPTSLFWFL